MRTLSQCHWACLNVNIAVVNDICIIVTADVKCRRCLYTLLGICNVDDVCVYRQGIRDVCKCRRCLIEVDVYKRG